MTLSDRQIDRYSRQIVLAEIGGRGQQRLLAARVALVGGGPLLDTAARYLAGAGIGTLRLTGGAAGLAAALRAANDDVAVAPGDVAAGDAALLAADLPAAALLAAARQAAAAGVPLIAAAVAGGGGWLWRGDGCAACAGVAAAGEDGGARTALAAVAATLLGGLAALAALQRALGGVPAGAPLVRFDAATAELQPLAPAARPDCPRCRPPH